LCVVPSRFAQIALSTETLLDMSTLSIEDVTGRLKAVEDRAEAPARTTVGGQLLLTEEQWAARLRERKQAARQATAEGGGRRQGRRRSCRRQGSLPQLRQDRALGPRLQGAAAPGAGAPRPG